MVKTVATATDTVDQPTSKPAAKLAAGDWFLLPESGGEAAEVLSVHPGSDASFVVYRTASDREPCGLRWNGALPICGPEEIEKATRLARRYEIADRLETFIGILTRHDVPIPTYGNDIVVHLDDVAEVDKVAATLGIPAATEYGQHQVVWPAGAGYDAPFRAKWFAYVPRDPKPEPAKASTTGVAAKSKPAADTGLDYSRPADGDASPAAVPAGVDGQALSQRSRLR